MNRSRAPHQPPLAHPKHRPAILVRDIPGFWENAPSGSISVESTWQEFVRSVGGTVVKDIIAKTPTFDNADFAFLDHSVVAEIKEIETEFSESTAFSKGFADLIHRLMAEQPNWRPALFDGDGSVPPWFNAEVVRLFRPPLSRIIKKANRQLRETMLHFNIRSNTGLLLLVNDGFTSISPQLIRALISQILIHSYSSIACCIYLTVNRYIELPNNNEPKLLWVPTYSETATENLVDFVDQLGRKWFEFLETKTGPYTSRTEVPASENILSGAKAIRLPEA